MLLGTELREEGLGGGWQRLAVTVSSTGGKVSNSRVTARSGSAEQQSLLVMLVRNFSFSSELAENTRANGVAVSFI